MPITQHSETIDACRFCFMCRHVCTLGVASGWESDTPRGKGLVLFRILKGYSVYTSDLVEAVYRCCLCGVCRDSCRGGYDMPQALLAARREIVSQGAEPSAAREIRSRILNTGNPFGLPPAERFQAIDAVFTQHAEVLYYVGCDTAYHQPGIANALIAILKRRGVDFTLLGDEICSGKPLTVLGYAAEARAVAEALAARIRATRCKVLVTACPSSYDAFKNDYAGLLDGIEIRHAAGYLPAPPARPDLHRVPISIQGGVFPLMYPHLARQAAGRIFDEAERSGSSSIVTTCPVTKRILTTVNDTGIGVHDLVELAAGNTEDSCLSTEGSSPAVPRR